MKLSMLTIMALLALAGCASVKPSAPPPLAPPSHSVAEAQGKLAVAARERAKAEAEFAASERQCYTRFLVNKCLDTAREKRRTALTALHQVEIEAERYQRQAKVDEHDRDIARAEQEFRAQEAKIAAQPPAPPYQPPPESPPKQAKGNRAAEHAAKMKRIAEEEKAGAAKRAANVEAYERRKADSEKRQRAVEEKKKAAAAEAEAK